MEPVTDSGFKVPSSSSGTVSSGDDWEPLSPTAQVQSKEFLNEMDLTDEDSWEEDFRSSGECFTTALKTDDKVDWEWTDWMRPDRLYAQARRRENDSRAGSKSTMPKMTERMQNLTTVNGLSCNGSGDYQRAGTSKRKAGNLNEGFGIPGKFS